LLATLAVFVSVTSQITYSGVDHTSHSRAAILLPAPAEWVHSDREVDLVACIKTIPTAGTPCCEYGPTIGKRQFGHR
jgi:hypothetical protein